MVTFLNASVVLRFSASRCFDSCSTWPGLRRYAHLSFFGFSDAGPLWGRATRGTPALTRARPRFEMLDVSQGALALILASSAVKPTMYCNKEQGY